MGGGGSGLDVVGVVVPESACPVDLFGLPGWVWESPADGVSVPSGVADTVAEACDASGIAVVLVDWLFLGSELESAALDKDWSFAEKLAGGRSVRVSVGCGGVGVETRLLDDVE